jgi:hypothetical protein
VQRRPLRPGLRRQARRRKSLIVRLSSDAQSRPALETSIPFSALPIMVSATAAIATPATSAALTRNSAARNTLMPSSHSTRSSQLPIPVASIAVALSNRPDRVARPLHCSASSGWHQLLEVDVTWLLGVGRLDDVAALCASATRRAAADVEIEPPCQVRSRRRSVPSGCDGIATK